MSAVDVELDDADGVVEPVKLDADDERVFRTEDEAAFWREAHASFCRRPSAWSDESAHHFADFELAQYRARRRNLIGGGPYR